MEENTSTPNATQDTPKKCINAGRPVYFSYARNSSSKPEWEHISDCVDLLLDAFDKENVEYRLDKRDISMGDRISDFEKEIGWNSEAVVLVFSDKYFRSMHCMYEFVEIKKSLQHNPNKRLLCIKSGDFNLSDTNYVMELERYWSNMKADYEAIEYHRLRAHSGTEKAAKENDFYIDDIRTLYSFFSAINYSNAAHPDLDFFLDSVKKYYSNTPPPVLTKPEEKKIKFVRQFASVDKPPAQDEEPSVPVEQPESDSQFTMPPGMEGVSMNVGARSVARVVLISLIILIVIICAIG